MNKKSYKWQLFSNWFKEQSWSFYLYCLILACIIIFTLFFYTTNSTNVSGFLELASLPRYFPRIFRFRVRFFFYPVLAEDSLSKVVYIWRCSTAVCMDGGWFFKREINNSEGSAENVTRASFRTLPRHVNEKKPREHILTSTIKNIVHILSGSPLCRV